ncbi:protein of unknown function DUF1624 [Methanocorpusculum labreanum Z]|uniref:Heparan-alpha-glucosaminide N-acetyltransferase catalytic domain-containing protein n=1 Tax=Methanocorpusculum labreanum (strain ATCC 43576 / DSM 4855 / Z) TaxID=410358 RepID=A2SQB7_METLZ|nr:heparan-alpha-glucosaminide N-acetyltransferase [Methanocorpusculum labreanum]ABN06523.1 protein of unknown function DUF1624 [Methanocorpusculum labreanum Z]
MRGSRYFELDAARGIALILMILYHILFCLYFFGTGLVPWFDPYTMSGAPIAFLFIVIAGISLVLSTGRETSPVKAAKKLVIRSLYLLCIAAVITIVTWIVYPEETVVFGILHLIGVATILAIPFVVMKVKPYVPLVFGLICIVLSPFVSMLRGPAFLIPFGITYNGFATLDYEPLIPWFGVVLLGVALGQVIYKGGVRRGILTRLGEMPRVLAPLCFIGRHTLIIYIVHVPIIIGVLFLLGLVSL